MPKIQVSKTHSLPREELESKVEQYLTKLRDDKLKSVGFGFAWKPDRRKIDLTGTGFKGEVTVGDQEVAIFIDLGLMLTPFKATVEDSLKRGLDKYLV